MDVGRVGMGHIRAIFAGSHVILELLKFLGILMKKLFIFFRLLTYAETEGIMAI